MAVSESEMAGRRIAAQRAYLAAFGYVAVTKAAMMIGAALEGGYSDDQIAQAIQALARVRDYRLDNLLPFLEEWEGVKATDARVKTNLYFDAGIFERARALKKSTGRSLASIIESAIALYCDAMTDSNCAVCGRPAMYRVVMIGPAGPGPVRPLCGDHAGVSA